MHKNPKKMKKQTQFPVLLSEVPIHRGCTSGKKQTQFHRRSCKAKPDNVKKQTQFAPTNSQSPRANSCFAKQTQSHLLTANRQKPFCKTNPISIPTPAERSPDSSGMHIGKKQSQS
jgi:hypothetical protein